MGLRIVPSECFLCKGRASFLPYAPRFLRHDYTGHVFGRLHVLHFFGMGHGRPYWCCACSCGTPSLRAVDSLRSGHTKSCGCLADEQFTKVNTIHGMSGTGIHHRWVAMHERCRNPHNAAFHNYGARGITVCERWHEFANFYTDMGDPLPGMSLDRINNDLGYCRENCRWATPREQINNTRRNRRLTYQEETHTLEEWAQQTGLSSTTLGNRLKRGWSTEAILTTPPHKRGRSNVFLTYQGKRQTIARWAEELGLSYETLRKRFKVSGWSLEKALTTPLLLRRKKHVK